MAKDKNTDSDIQENEVNNGEDQNTTASETTAMEAAVVKEPATERQLAQADKTMRQILNEQPKVKMIIPEDPNNPDDVVPVGVNGVIYAIPRGIEVEVPQSIYDTWKYSYDQTRKVDRKIRESVTKEIVVMG